MMRLADRCLLLDGVDLNGRAVLLQLYTAWFMIAAAFAVLIAVLPLVLVDIVGKTEAATYQGWLAAATACSGLVLCSSTGHLSDRFGRAGLLRIWCAAYAAGILLVMVGYQFGHVSYLFLARLPAFSVPFFISLALCSDVATGPALMQSHGHIGAVFGLAALAGSLAAGFIGRIWGNAGALAASLGFACVGMVSVLQLNPPPHQKGVHAGFFDALRVVSRDPLLLLTVLSFALIRVGNVNVNVVYVLYAAYRFEWTIFEVSVLLGVRGALTVYLQTAGMQALSRQPARVAITVLFLTMWAHPASMVAMALASTGPQFAVMTLLNTVTFVSISILTSTVAALSHRDGVSGLALGAVGSIQNGIEIGGAIAFGSLLRYSIATYPPHSLGIGLPFYVNAVWYVGACLVLHVADFKFGHGRIGWRISKAEISDTEESTPETSQRGTAV